jgi:hypothetical protein
MKKTYQFLVVLAAMLLGATNVSAERIPLTADGFFTHDGWGLNAVKTGDFQASYVIGEPSGCAFGDSECSAYLDLGAYSKLYVNMVGCDAEGNVNGSTPRIFLNSDKSDGKNDHLIVPATAGYTTQEEDGTYVVDLEKIKKEYGFVYITAIKGSAWDTRVILNSIEVEKNEGAKQVGWVNILTNSDFENDDLTSFAVSLSGGEADDDNSAHAPTTVEEGMGQNGSRALVLTTKTGVQQDWCTQLFIKFPEQLTEGTKWRFAMDVKSDYVATFGGGCHADPRAWKMPSIMPEFTTSTDWQTLTAEGTISADFESNGVMSIAFDLNRDKEVANKYYFDNVRFEVYKVGTSAFVASYVAQIDFGFDTNLAELTKAAGSSRVVYPADCATVKVNGQPIEIISIEGYSDGRFYIFFPDEINPTDDVQITFKNPAGDLQLKYTSGPNAGEVVGAVDEKALYNESIAVEDAYPFVAVLPTVVSASPEQGSFNVAPGLKELTAKFDKRADVSQAVATLDGQALTITPVNPDAEGFASEIKMTYAGADLANGRHTVNIKKVYAEVRLDEEVFVDTTYTFSVGPVDVTDLPYDIIPLNYFNDCANNGIPEGFLVYADGMEERTSGNTYGSNARLFSDFAAGGDFTHALYFRRNYVTYGKNDDTHVLALEAGKTYNLSFNTARWKSSGQYQKVQILNSNGDVKFEQVVTCDPDVNGSKDAVKNSSAYSFNFVPDANDNYELRFIVMKNATDEVGDADMYETLLANVKLTYIPETFGAMEMYEVDLALEKAKKTQADNADERFAGEAQTALNNKIAEVEAGKATYTSPSECVAAVEALAQCGDNLINHATLCKNYDQKIKDGADVVRQNENPSNTGVPTKFVNLPLFSEIKAAVDKYHGVSEMVNEGTEEEPNWQKHYTYDKLTDDAQLTTAINELSEVVEKGQKMFTSGESKMYMYGVAPLVERLRRGAEAIKVLEPENPIIEEALNAFDDDDELAEKVKNNLKAALYKKINAGENLFPEDEQTGLAQTHDLSVFVKNPNVYAPAFTMAIPGWTNLKGNAEAWSSWGPNPTHNANTAYPEDVAFHPGWHAEATTEQTITDLPAGIYNIVFKCRDHSGDITEEVFSYVYVKISSTPDVEEGADMDKDINTAGWAKVTHQDGMADIEIPNIIVEDGMLTLGCTWSNLSQAFLDDVHIYLTGKADVDYSALYDEVATGVDKAAATAKVRAIELYDLNGQRIPVAKKGVVIVKKQMSDGTVKMEKVIK